MTRKEAIIILGNIPIDGKDKCYSIAEYQEAKTMAIKALEQEPCEDAISRQAVIEEIENGIKAGNYEDGYEKYPHINDMDDIIECIKYADSIQPKPKTGHWKIIPFSNNYGEYRPNKYMCSECGWEIDLCRGLQQDTGHRLFCEHCGAKMKVGE